MLLGNAKENDKRELFKEGSRHSDRYARIPRLRQGKARQGKAELKS